MELRVQSMGQRPHMNNPFLKENQTPHANTVSRTLQDLCCRTIVRRATLRGLKERGLACLPSLIRRQVTSLSTDDFLDVVYEPFRDSFRIFQQYKVQCWLDGGEYMAVRAVTCNTVQALEDFWQWVDMTHPNLMCVYALALDVKNNDVFLIMDIPETTLYRLQTILVSQGLCFPEYFLWKVAQQLSSVMMHVEDRGLAFGRFDVKDVYVVRDRLLLDSKLTRTFWEISASAQHEGRLGSVLTKLASIARANRKSNAPPRFSSEVLFLDGFDPVTPESAVTYSSDLFDILRALHSTSPPPLASVNAKAIEMMTMFKAQLKKRMANETRAAILS